MLVVAAEQEINNYEQIKIVHNFCLNGRRVPFIRFDTTVRIP